MVERIDCVKASPIQSIKSSLRQSMVWVLFHPSSTVFHVRAQNTKQLVLNKSQMQKLPDVSFCQLHHGIHCINASEFQNENGLYLFMRSCCCFCQSFAQLSLALPPTPRIMDSGFILNLTRQETKKQKHKQTRSLNVPSDSIWPSLGSGGIWSPADTEPTPETGLRVCWAWDLANAIGAPKDQMASPNLRTPLNKSRGLARGQPQDFKAVPSSALIVFG